MKKKNLLLTAIAIFGLATITMAQVPSYVPTTGLVGWWPFTGNAIDSSGNANNGTVNGATLTIDRFGNNNNAYEFNGTSYIDFTAITFNQDFSISLWFNADTLYQLPCGQHEILGTFTNAQPFPNGQVIGINELGGISVGNGNIGTPYNNYYTTNNWYNAVYTYSANTQTLNLYVNNIFESSRTSFAMMNYGTILRAGCRANSGFFCGFVGKIDDIGVWNRSLTQQEITSLYTSSYVGINEVSQSNLFSVYPNPAQSVITVNTDAKLVGSLFAIYDNAGKLVKTGNIKSENTTIELGNLSSGIYMFSLGENMKQTFKVIKE